MPFEAGEGVIDITPPLGVELAGFHKPAGQERRCTGIRQKCTARALSLRSGKSEAAIIVLDVLGLSAEFARKAKKQISKGIGIPEKNIRLCATHSHSTPALMFLRQWGALSPEFEKLAAERVVQAAVLAKKDLASADFYYGKDRVQGGNFNRTSKTWKTDADFGKES